MGYAKTLALCLALSTPVAAHDGHPAIYDIEVVRVVDGDTVHVQIEVAFGMILLDTLRFYDIDTPEMRGADKDRGQAAKDFTDAWLRGDILDGPYLDDLWIDTVKPNARGKYGRVLAYVYRGDDPISLNAALVAAGHVKEAG